MPFTVLTKRIAHQERQESAAMRDFNPAHDPLGSKRESTFCGLMSASAGCGHAAAWPYEREVSKPDALELRQTRFRQRPDFISAHAACGQRDWSRAT
jgi:hypothetical protein